MLVKIFKVFDGLHNSAGGNGTNGEMGVLVSEPGRHGTWIRSTDGNPWVFVDAIHVVDVDLIDEIGEIA